MKRLLFVCAVGALLAASAARSDLRAAQKTVGRIEISLRLEQNASGAADRAFLDVVLVNDSSSTIFFAEQSSDWDYQLDITGPDGSPLRLTNYGCRVLPEPEIIFRNIGRDLHPGDRDHVESIELNRLYALDRAGSYRLVARRRVWQPKPAYSSQPKELLAKCRSFSDCYDTSEAASPPFSFELKRAYPDVSPQCERADCIDRRSRPKLQ